MQIKVKHLEGYAYGAIQPSAVLSFSNLTSNIDQITTQLANLKVGLPAFEGAQRFSGETSLIEQNEGPALFVTLIDILNRHCGDQRFTPIKAFEEDGVICFAVPTLSPQMITANTRAVHLLLQKLAKGMSHEQLSKTLDGLKKRMRPFLPGGTNAGNFIAAAAERKIPFKIFSNRYIFFGYGSGSRIFNSSLTDQESVTGVQLAKSKVDTNRLLKMSGIPVAEQARVRTIDDALRFAEKVGYPVVLKPEAEEQGRGVFANIVDENELKECFEHLSQSRYRSILIEQHVPGDVYRINTIDDEVVRVVKRIPAKVVGDGRSTIEELLTAFNNQPIRNDPNSSMVKLKLDDDVVRTISKLSLQAKSIPKKEDVVYLTSTSSVSRGGHAIDFYEDFHLENRMLCEKISRIMRLNITGIDVLAVDASQTWRNGNFVVCEVNSQPQLGVSHMHIYHDFISRKIKGKPHIKLSISSVYASETTLFDPISDTMEIVISPESVLRHGCQVQYFDDLEISDDVSDEDRQKIERMLVSVTPELDEK